MRIKKRLLPLLLAAASFACFVPASVASTGRVAVPDRKLEEWLRKGYAFNETLGRPDSALYYFSLVENRYSERMSKPDKEMCARALLGKCVVLFSAYFDYPNAFEAVLEAERIAAGAGLKMPRIDVCMAGMYQTLADESSDSSLFAKAMEHYARAVETAVATRDTVTADLAFTNAAHLVSSGRVATDLSDIWKRYSSLPADGTPGVRRRFNASFYQALGAARRGDAGQVDRIMSEALSAVPDRQEFLRMKAIGHIFRATAVLESGANARARAILDEALAYATKHRIEDARVEVYSLLARCASEGGADRLGREYRLRSLEIKDSLAYNAKCLKAEELRFLESIRRAEAQAAEADADRRVRDFFLCFLLVLLAVIASFLFALHKKNKRLRSNIETLYRHSVNALQTKSPEPAESGAGDAGEPDDDGKYKGSSLKDPAREELSRRIAAFMEKSTEIYSTDFSVARLAEAVQSNAKYVSQTVNEEFGCNFNTYINGFRVREACRRFISDEQVRRLTIEAVAAEVGFNSRSSFIAAFKRETGLTPSEFKKQASK